jgi:hypothetical protein
MGEDMRTISFAILIAIATTSSAFAIDDCNKLVENKRLECLQHNNQVLSEQIAQINSTLAHVLLDNKPYNILNGEGDCFYGPSGGIVGFGNCKLKPPSEYQLHSPGPH